MKIEHVERKCDYCGTQDNTGENVKPTTVTIGGISREIDACTTCMVQQTSWLATIGRKTEPPQRKRTAQDRRNSAKIRAWAISQGYDIPPAGRIKQSTIAAYKQAHHA